MASVIKEKEGGPLWTPLYKELRAEILSRNLRDGSKLSESYVCKKYGVSRTPVREALFQLEAEGLIKIIPNRGAFVTGLTDRDISDIFDMRCLLEAQAAEWAVMRMSAEEIDKLSEALDKIKEERKGSRFPVQEVASPQNLPAPSAIEQQRELNYFAPMISLQRLLKSSWIKDVRANDEYNEQWTDTFIDALMQSEFREHIALEWGKEDRRLQIKGYIVGLLKDAGVLKGSYDKISEKVSLIENPRTFSKYMGAGKKQPYADWVKDYVSPQER